MSVNMTGADETPYLVASHLSLHCLLMRQLKYNSMILISELFE